MSAMFGLATEGNNTGGLMGMLRLSVPGNRRAVLLFAAGTWRVSDDGRTVPGTVGRCPGPQPSRLCRLRTYVLVPGAIVNREKQIAFILELPPYGGHSIIGHA